MDWFLTAVLFIVALGLLICLHELGHFTMAKIFGVYCNEFSIGFGPAIIHKRKEGKETYFSLRAIPLGGYVSMYGEEDAMSDDSLNLPPERSLEGIKKWKKAIIISAGVVVNALLAIVLFAVANLCFETVQITNTVQVNEGSTLVEKGIQNDDRLSYLVYEKYDDENKLVSTKPYYEGEDNYYYVVDDDVEIQGSLTHYVLTYGYYTDKENNNVSKGFALFDGYLNTDAKFVRDNSSSFYIPNMDSEPNALVGEYKFNVDLKFARKVNDDTNYIPIILELSYNNGEFADIGIELVTNKFFAPFKERFAGIWIDFGDSSVAIVKALGTLFTPQGFNQVSSIVGIFKYSNSVLNTRTFATYLRMWGMISVNLAIFNLLPFPGLDGWQLLVTAIEGISKKKVPTKFKAIMNIIGFALLLGLMIVIVAKDIIMW